MTDYEKRLVEIGRKIAQSQGEQRENWVTFLLGYIDALDVLSVTADEIVKSK